MTDEEKSQLMELLMWKRQMESADSIPLNIDQSFKARFIKNILNSSTKSPATETVTINTAVPGTYSALAVPDGFFLFNDGGTPRFIPYFL